MPAVANQLLLLPECGCMMLVPCVPQGEETRCVHENFSRGHKRCDRYRYVWSCPLDWQWPERRWLQKDHLTEHHWPRSSAAPAGQRAYRGARATAVHLLRCAAEWTEHSDETRA